MNELIPKQYVVNDQQEVVAIQLDPETYRKAEEVLENHGLYCLIQEQQGDGYLTLEEAQAFYKRNWT